MAFFVSSALPSPSAFLSLSFLKIFIYLFIYLFIWLCRVLVAARWLLSCGMQTLSCGMHVGSSSLTRDRSRAPCIGSEESFLFLINLFYFYYFWLRSVFVAACGLSLVAASRGYTSLRCVSFSLWWLLLLQSMGSRHAGFSSCGSQALERRLSSCGARA